MASFNLGLGVFETLRVELGHALFVEEHWVNLKSAAHALGLKVRTDFRKSACRLPVKSGRWRWIVEPETSYDLFSPEKLDAKRSFTLSVAPQRLGSANWDAHYKTLSYLTHLQARRSVKTDEALLLNEHGHLASGAMSNLFWVRNGRLYTPSLEAGCRAGIVRGWVMEQTSVKADLYTISAIQNADEIFITNSLIGIMPVRRFERRQYKVGPVVGRLRKLFRAH